MNHFKNVPGCIWWVPLQALQETPSSSRWWRHLFCLQHVAVKQTEVNLMHRTVCNCTYKQKQNIRPGNGSPHCLRKVQLQMNLLMMSNEKLTVSIDRCSSVFGFRSHWHGPCARTRETLDLVESVSGTVRLNWHCRILDREIQDQLKKLFVF